MTGGENRGCRAGHPVVALALLLAPCSSLLACGDGTETSTAPDAAEPGGLSVTVDPSTAAPGATVEASVVNETDQQFTYGAGYELERAVDGAFVPVELPDRPVIQIGYIANPGETGPPVSVMLPASLEPGTYRVVIQRDLPGVGDLSGQFEVT